MGTIIGIVISAIIAFAYLIGRKSKLFVGVHVILTILFLLLMWFFFRELNWWNIVVLPVGIIVITFISLVIAPFTPNEMMGESVMRELPDFYNEYDSSKPMGRLKVPYFKQTYDRELQMVLYSFTSSVDDTNEIVMNLLSNVYYPFSTVNKQIIENHVKQSIDMVALSKPYLRASLNHYPDIYKNVFNIFVCLLDINEDATENIEKLNKDRR